MKKQGTTDAKRAGDPPAVRIRSGKQSPAQAKLERGTLKSRLDR
jgi:hypothetical protein